MWEALKNVLTEAKDALGIEIPGLPDTLTSAGEAATTTAQQVSESATSAVDGLTAAGEAAAADVAGTTAAVPEIPAAAAESATQAVPGITDILGGTTRP